MIMHRRAALGIVLLLLSLAITIRTAGSASAAISGCRHDPIVQLSNGAVITLAAETDDAAGDVTSITYTLHAPAGTSVTGVTYDQYQSLEHLEFIPDERARLYKTETVVQTRNSDVKVTADAAVANKACNQPPKAKMGWPGQDLAITFNCT